MSTEIKTKIEILEVMFRTKGWENRFEFSDGFLKKEWRKICLLKSILAIEIGETYILLKGKFTKDATGYGTVYGEVIINREGYLYRKETSW
ncbi:MAG: hypothetical protein ACOCQR_01715 [bacterium]